MTRIKTDGKHNVTPELAQDLLDTYDNSLNRDIKSKDLSSYTADMLSGNWHYYGDPIRITSTNKLADGQHRLRAIVASKKAQDMYFIFNLQEEVAEGVSIMEVIDQSTRSPYEVLKIAHRDLINPKELVPLMKKITLFNDRNALASLPQLGNKEILAFAERHQPLSRLDEAVDRGRNLAIRGEGIIDKNDGAFLALTLGSCERGNEFLEGLAPITVSINGAIDVNNQPLLASDPLANLAMNLKTMRASKLKGANTLRDRLRLIFKAYDVFLKGDEVSGDYLYSGSKLLYPSDYAFYTLGV